jgi:hypothetical protein
LMGCVSTNFFFARGMMVRCWFKYTYAEIVPNGCVAG